MARLFLEATVRDDAGNVQRSTAVYIQPLGADPSDRTSDVTIYDAPTGLTTLPQPLLTDLHGQLLQSDGETPYYANLANLQYAWRDLGGTWHVRPAAAGLADITGLGLTEFSGLNTTGAVDDDVLVWDNSASSYVAHRGYKVKNLLDFAGIHADGVTSDDTAFANAYAWLNGAPRRALKIPPGIYATVVGLPVITRSDAVVVTQGQSVTRLVMLPAATTGRVVSFDGGASPVSSARMDGFTVEYQNDLSGVDADHRNPIYFGKASICRQRNFRITGSGAGATGGSGVVQAASGSTGCVVEGVDALIDFSLGGDLVRNLGSAHLRVVVRRVNGGGSDGAFKGGSCVLVDPPDGSFSDTGWYDFGTAQGGLTTGPDYGFKLVCDGSRGHNNQWLVGVILDHFFKAGIHIVAPPGSTGSLRNIHLVAQRLSGDGPACVAIIDWQSTGAAQNIIVEEGEYSHRQCPRPVCISSAPNTLEVEWLAGLIDFSANAVAPHKTEFSFQGKTRIRNPRIRRSIGDGSSLTARAGEAQPYEMRRYIVDATGGSTKLKRVDNNAETAAINWNDSAATLQGKLEAIFAVGDIVVQDGPGGPYGPTTKTELAAAYTVGDLVVDCVDASALPSSGSVFLTGSGNANRVDYTSKTGNLLNVDPAGAHGTGTYVVGTLVASSAQGSGVPYTLLFKGSYAPGATTAPGYGATPAVPELVVSDNSLTGTGVVGGGRRLASIDTLMHACPLNNFATFQFDLDYPPDLEDPTVAWLKEPAYTN